MDRERLLEARAEVLTSARRLLEKDGELIPVAFFFMPDAGGGLAVAAIEMPWRNDAQKDIAAAFLKDMASKRKAAAFMFLSEVWTYPRAWSDAQKIGAHRAGIFPMDVPEREELVWVTWEEPGRVEMGGAPINRADGKPTFGEVDWTEMRDKDKVGGRFFAILPENRGRWEEPTDEALDATLVRGPEGKA